MIIAITGGIGTGKSSVANILAEYRYIVYSADKISHDVLKQKDIIDKLVSVFSDSIIENNNINRKKLREIVFSDNNKLKLLNEIMHPEIIKAMKLICNKYYNSKQIVFFEVPLLFELNLQNLFNKTLLVYANKNNQISRIIIRDNITKENAINILNNQMDIEVKKNLADYYIDNNSNESDLKKNVNIFLKELKNAKIEC